MGVKYVYRMSKIDKAIEEFTHKSALGFMNVTPLEKNLYEALQQAKKDREDHEKVNMKLANEILDLRIKYEPKKVRNRLNEIKKLLEL